MKIARGLKIKDLRVGNGRVAEKGTIAIAHVTCSLNRGDKVYSTHDAPGIPTQFKVGGRDVFVAVDQGVVGMREGGLRLVKVSPHLAYDEHETFPNLPTQAVLRYEIELQTIRDKWDDSLAAKYAAS